MATIDLDDLLEKKEKISFRLFSKDYVLPELSYALTLKLEEQRKIAAKAVKDENLEAVMKSSITVISTIFPDLSSEELEEKAALSQLKEITSLINKTWLEGEGEEENAELAYYRETYKDEFRKKELEPEKKKRGKI